MLAFLQTAHSDCVRCSCFAYLAPAPTHCSWKQLFLLFIPLNCICICQCFVLYTRHKILQNVCSLLEL